ncbi:MAG: hypothetical protein ACXVCY_13185 [Pseudobdellovibrionaceae bacterium]
MRLNLNKCLLIGATLITICGCSTTSKQNNENSKVTNKVTLDTSSSNNKTEEKSLTIEISPIRNTDFDLEKSLAKNPHYKIIPFATNKEKHKNDASDLYFKRVTLMVSEALKSKGFKNDGKQNNKPLSIKLSWKRNSKSTFVTFDTKKQLTQSQKFEWHLKLAVVDCDGTTLWSVYADSLSDSDNYLESLPPMIFAATQFIGKGNGEKNTIRVNGNSNEVTAIKSAAIL